MIGMRIGHGYDVHRLVEGRRLVIGGVEIPYEKGLLGHSDADVLTHAVMDTDIGHLFPDNDDRYLGISSLVLAEEVGRVIRQKGYEIGNVDATIIAQRPKMYPHIPEMRKRLAEALGILESALGIKATTEEGLGFTGEGQGIAAHAVCLLVPAGIEK